MSYLSHPLLFFSGSFHADPSTVNNTPDNYNPNANFPPDNGSDVGNNIQLYWNPNGTGNFALDCTITQVCDSEGNCLDDHEWLNQPLKSRGGTSLCGAKLVDLDPMQQNVTELWGLALELPECDSISLGDFISSAYSNAWIQVIGGQGDYAGSALYQSVISLDDDTVEKSTVLQQLIGDNYQGGLSISFVLRAYNSSSHNFLVNSDTRSAMNQAGVPDSVTDKLKPIEAYNQRTYGTGTAGQIPTTSYFKKLLQAFLTSDEFDKYGDKIKGSALRPYSPRTDFDFTHGQVFGVIGSSLPAEPTFLTADRMLTPPSVTNDMAPYSAYFAPFTVNSEGNLVTINLGNALPSTKPAAEKNSYVAAAALGSLQLCYFDSEVSVANAVILAEISYQDNDFYIRDAGLARLKIDQKYTEAVKSCPLGIISTTISSAEECRTILLQENKDGYYFRANQFVFRMNPGVETTAQEPRGATQQVEIYLRQFGQPVADTEIAISLMPSLEASAYTNNTLGTGGSSGLVNMGVPSSALKFPEVVSTDAEGIARFTIAASDPGSPRGYVDGQIYFLKYGFHDPASAKSYVQSPDNLISIQVYSQQPEFEDITWENFVKNTLGQYGKLYPIMGFLNLQDEQVVINNAEKIHKALNRAFDQANLMPVTRDLSASRLVLINRWLCQHYPCKKAAFAKDAESA